MNTNVRKMYIVEHFVADIELELELELDASADPSHTSDDNGEESYSLYISPIVP